MTQIVKSLSIEYVKLIYYQLNEHEYGHCSFPLDFCGYFSDGLNMCPIFLPLQGQIVHEHQGTDITAGDKEVAKMNDIVEKIKKLLALNGSGNQTGNQINA